MFNLRLLLGKNQSCLAKNRARVLYCEKSIRFVEEDAHLQYGIFAGYWDEWVKEVEDLQTDLKENIALTEPFVYELGDYLRDIEVKKTLTKSDSQYLEEVTSLAEAKLLEQTEVLKEIDSRIDLHKQMTNKLIMVETLEELNNESDQ